MDGAQVVSKSSSSSSSGGSGGTATAPDGSTGAPYDIGSPTVTDLYVSTTGSNSNSGTSVSSPLLTLEAAWNALPATMTTTGYRINLLPGEHRCGADESSCVNYFADKTGTHDYPIIIQSVNAAGTYTAGEALIRGGKDIDNVSYLYLIGVEMAAGGTYPTNNSGNSPVCPWLSSVPRFRR
ncbi:MAG: hypothetical protein HQM16_14235 [Deltaproteobacteria bacterium]|nr:hypothetical protein [Deltaproteobacteria bacterium]